MNYSYPGFGKIGKVSDAFWVSAANENNEWCLVDDPFVWTGSPVSSNETTIAQPESVSLDREDGDVRVDPLKDLIGYCFGTGKGRGESHVLPMALFPFGGEPRKDALLERLLHDRKSVNRDINVARFRRRLRQTVAAYQRGCDKDYKKPGF